MMLWKQEWKAPLSVVVAVAVASDYLLSLVVVSVVVVALVAGWRSKHLLPLAVAVLVAVGGWRQRLPRGPWGRNSEFEPALALAICLACVIDHEDCGMPLEKRQQPILGQALLSRVAKPTRGAHRPDTIAHGLSDLGED